MDGHSDNGKDEGVNRVCNTLAKTVPLAIATAIAGIFAVVELSEVERSRLEWDQHTRKAEIYGEILKSVGRVLRERF